MTRKSNLGGINSQDGLEAVKDRYNTWAKQYDQDLKEAKYNLPSIMASIADGHIIDKNSSLLDAGAGTGLSGAALSQCGFTNVTAVDFSSEMLREAKKSGIYTQIVESDLCDLKLDSNSYDHTIAVGTIGVAPKEALLELLRVTKVGGLIIFSNRTNEHYDPTNGFEDLCLEMIATGSWSLVETKAGIVGDSKPGTSPFVAFVYRKGMRP